MNHIVAVALAETRFNEFRKYSLRPDEIRFCLAYPDLALFDFWMKYHIAWALYYSREYLLY